MHGKKNFCVHERVQLFPALPEEVQGNFRPLWPFGAREEPLRKGDFILNQTNHYQLSQWEPTDRILMENFNGDNQKIDAALKANADAAASAAAAAAARGNCQIWMDTYTGTGKAGVNNKNTIAFPHKPVLFRICQTDNTYHIVSFHGCRELYVMNGSSVYVCTASWSGNTLSWYHEDSYVRQMNEANKVYHVVALFAVDDGE